MKKTLLYISLILILTACHKDEVKEQGHAATFAPPEYFPKTYYAFDRNPVKQEVFDLGRKLFYDGILSRDGTIACGSCHIQGAAFTHHSHQVSHGIDDQLGIRNAPSLANMAFQKEFFWIGGVVDLDLFHVVPIEEEVEMGEEMPNVIRKLKAHKDYPNLFKKAFGEEAEINYANMAKALSQFVALMVSDNSKYDQYLRGETQLSDQELRGLTLFQQKCASCHAGELFTDQSYRDNGIGVGDVDDKGRYLISLDPSDTYKFKVPSLRNVARTFPYMHDGRFFSLEQVLNHYQGGVKDTPNLDPSLKDGSKMGVPLTQDQKNDIIAFLKTLTDQDFLKDKRFSEIGTDIIR